MAKPASSKGGKQKPPADRGWSSLTWSDLEDWAGSRSVARGRSYQSGRRVTDLGISDDGELLATVQGTERYATMVAFGPGQKVSSLESNCSCPVGYRCKHAVAVVAEYLHAIAAGRDVPRVSDDDPRWSILEDSGSEAEDDWDDDEDGEPWDDDDVGDVPVAKPRKPARGKRRGAAAEDWDAKIEQHLRAKSQGELADLALSLVRRFPEIYQEFRERIALQEGDVERLTAEARREIRKVTSEPAWRNHWDDEGHTPDYSRVRHRLERLLELGHADAVADLGREFLERGSQQVGEAHDEGETATAFAECLPVIFEAVTRSSLSGPERLLFAIDAVMDDDFDTASEASDTILDAPSKPEDWSVVADTLTGRLKPAPDSAARESEAEQFSRSYQRDRLTGWIAYALREAGRGDEQRALYESEARITGSYERLVNYLIEERCFDDAARWAREGIEATSAKYPGIAVHLTDRLGEFARKQKQWDVVAAHVARSFFERPGAPGFDELMKAAKKAGVEEPVRAAALRILETGVMHYRVTSPPESSAVPPRARASARKRTAKALPAAPSPDPKAMARPRLQIDPSWPLPIPDYLVPLLHRPGRYDPGPRPHLDVLLDMAIAAKRPDEVLVWFDKMRAQQGQSGFYQGALSYVDRVAEAVATAYPDRAIEIYQAALNAQLPHAQISAYETAVVYLKRLRPIYEATNRKGEWAALVESIREKYRGRPRFMELLDQLDGRTIVESARLKRR